VDSVPEPGFRPRGGGFRPRGGGFTVTLRGRYERTLPIIIIIILIMHVCEGDTNATSMLML
jgi:hypothetical protein